MRRACVPQLGLGAVSERMSPVAAAAAVASSSYHHHHHHHH